MHGFAKYINDNLKNGDFYLVTVEILDSDIFTNHGFELDETEYHKTLPIGKEHICRCV